MITQNVQLNSFKLVQTGWSLSITWTCWHAHISAAVHATLVRWMRGLVRNESVECAIKRLIVLRLSRNLFIFLPRVPKSTSRYLTIADVWAISSSWPLRIPATQRFSFKGACSAISGTTRAGEAREIFFNIQYSTTYKCREHLADALKITIVRLLLKHTNPSVCSTESTNVHRQTIPLIREYQGTSLCHDENSKYIRKYPCLRMSVIDIFHIFFRQQRSSFAFKENTRKPHQALFQYFSGIWSYEPTV